MIRKATILDALEISKLDQRNFVDCLSYEFIYSDLENNPFAYYFVYETNNRIVGYINCWVSDNTTILNFCVDEEYRNKGIGKSLIEKVLEVSVGIITLEVRVSNNNAINLYQKYGFEKALIRKGYYSDGEDAILMVRM